PTRAGQPYTFKYLVTEAMPDGPCKHSIREGDQLLSIDGHDVSVMDLAELVLQARGREDQEPRCTLLGALARTFSRQLDPVRRLMGFKVMPRAGRGSRAHIRVLRCKKDGRQVVKDILLTRGNWVGMFDDAARNGGTDSHGTADSDRVGILTWLRDLQRSPERQVQEMTSEAAAESLAANEPEDERVCRICQCSEDEAPEFGKLFTPCLCRGTMRFVHHVRCP
ncbi:MAG: PDZ domain-containing protein, partial [Promethearchaeia archaeon]